MNRLKYKVVVRIVLLCIALIFVIWTMSNISNPQSIKENGFFQIFNQ